MAEQTPLEIWIMSKISKTGYPTGNYKVKARKIRKGIPFNVTKADEIIFYRNFIKANGDNPFREMTKEEVDALTKYTVVDEKADIKFKRRRTNAEAEIKALKDQIKQLQVENKSKLTDNMNLKSTVEDLDEALSLNNESELNKEIETLVAANKKFEKENKSLKTKMKKLKNEVN